MTDKYPFYGHDDGLVISGPDTGFAKRPMTPAELAAREPALQIAKDIYRHACRAGVCYHEIWDLIAKAMAQAVNEETRELRKTVAISHAINEQFNGGCRCEICLEFRDDCIRALESSPPSIGDQHG